MKKRLLTILSLWGMGVSALFAQVNTPNTLSLPFPQNSIYNYGLKPANASGSDALAAYNAWKTEYVTSSGCQSGSYRVKFDFSNNQNHTVSEGIGYGMLLASYAGDKTIFDGLWKYYNRFLNGRGFMHWKVDNSTCTNVTSNGASDADCDVAMALYIAHWQWGSTGTINYNQECKNLIDKIQQYEIVSGTKVMRPGDDPSWTEAGVTLTNISYFCPAYFRAFAQIDNTDATFWTAAADQCYTVINNTLNATNGNTTNGLVPDWSNPSGAVPGQNVSGYIYQGQRFYYDAVRTPWRIGIDYLWWGTAAARTYCNKTTSFVQSLPSGSSSLKDGYYMNGTAFGTSHNNTFVGCMAVGAMASNNSNVQTHLNSSYTDNVNTAPYAGQYFNSTLKALTLFTLTGNFYFPPPGSCTAPALGADKNLCQGSPAVLNSGLTAGGRTFTWTLNGTTISGATSPTYNATAAGIYEVTSNEGGCIRKDAIEVFSATPTANFTFSNIASQVTFTDISTGGATSWSWTFGDAQSSTTQSPVHLYSSSGVYNVTLTIQNTCGTTNAITKQVTIGAPASAGGWSEHNFSTSNWQNVSAWTANATSLALSYPSCSEFAVTCTNPAQYAPFGITFKAAGSDAPQNLSQYPYVILKIKASVAINLRVDLGDNTTNCGGNPCTTSLNPTFIDLTTNVGTYKTVTLDFTGKFTNYDNTPMDATKIKQIAFTPNHSGTTYNGVITIDWVIAGYDNLDLSSNIADPSATCTTATINASNCYAESYLWNTGETTPSVTKGPGTYVVTISNYSKTVKDTIVVTGINTPVAGFSYSRNGLDVNFSDGSTDATSRSWDFGNSTTGTTANPSVSYASAGNYNVCLTATNSCGNNQKCINIPVCASITPNFTYAQGSGLTYNFTNTSTGGSPTGYNWDFGDGNTSTSTNPSNTYASAGTYTVVLSVSDACGSYQISKNISVSNCSPNPVSDFTHSVSGATATFTNTSTGSPTSYSWNFGDSQNSSATSPSHTYTAVGTYNVCLDATNACGTSQTCYNVTISSLTGILDKTAYEQRFEIYPNPTQSQVLVKLDNRIVGNGRVSLLDAMGNLLEEHNNTGAEYDFNLSAYPKGMYLIMVQHGESSYSRKLIKE